MARSKSTRQQRREEPEPNPIALPPAAEANTKPVKEIIPSTAQLPKQKKKQHPVSSASGKKKREKALKAAEFAGKLEAKTNSREQRKARKENAKKLWE